MAWLSKEIGLEQTLLSQPSEGTNSANTLVSALKIARPCLNSHSSSNILLNATNNNQYAVIMTYFPTLLSRTNLSTGSAFQIVRGTE